MSRFDTDANGWSGPDGLGTRAPTHASRLTAANAGQYDPNDPRQPSQGAWDAWYRRHTVARGLLRTAVVGAGQLQAHQALLDLVPIGVVVQ